MRILDIIIVAVYLALVVTVGIIFRGKGKSADGYFNAHGSFKGVLGTILIGLSITATLFSGISMIIYVSSAYSDGAKIGLALVSFPIAWVILRYWFLPRYLSNNWTHPYEIIEVRFGYSVRLLMSAMFILLRIGWMGVLIYAPTLIIIGSLGLGEEWFWLVVIILGSSATIYAAIGGIRSVIITDAIQLLIILGGLLFIAIFIFNKIDVPVSTIVSELNPAGKLDILDFTFDFTTTITLWSVVFGMSVADIGSYLADQMCIQRYLASESPKAATSSFTINMVGAFLLIMTLITVGLLLWLWYQHSPDPGRPIKSDQILAYFISTKLPPGVSGLLIAAILAATLNSSTSGINSLAGAIVNDWVRPLRKSLNSGELYKMGKWISVIIGAFATITAGLASELGPILESSQVLMGSFLGAMLGCMVLAVLPIKIRSMSLILGMVLGVGVAWVVAFSSISTLWGTPAALIVTLLVPAIDVLLIKEKETGSNVK